ncbi:O-antigen ligase family protein [Sphingobacterium siyangense]|uniref:O-antigen ligase family protein n=1 Tax=Sphingobacterium siyangense TaxID=459529 RepID=UPI003DA375B6
MYNVDTDQALYWIPFISLFGSMFLSTAILVLKLRDVRTFNNLFILVFIASVIGIILSYTNFTFIAALISTSSAKSEFANVYSEVIDRAPGFYGQQNLSAKSFVLSFLYLYVITFANSRQIIKNLLIIIALICIYFTGSRTSLILFFVQLMVFIPLLTNTSKLKLLIIVRYVVLGIGFVVILFSLSNYFVSLGLPDLTTRLNFGQESLNDDESVNLRVLTIQAYLNQIYENLFLGKGPAYRQEMIKRGIFPVGAQNEYLETALAFGVFAVIYYVLLIVFTIKHFFNIGGIYSRVICALILLFVLYGFSINYMFLDRFDVILFGGLFGLVLRERYIKNIEY